MKCGTWCCLVSQVSCSDAEVTVATLWMGLQNLLGINSFAVQSSCGLLVQPSFSGFLSAEIAGMAHNAQDEAQEMTGLKRVETHLLTTCKTVSLHDDF